MEKLPAGTKVVYRSYQESPDTEMRHRGTVKIWGRKWVTISREEDGKEDWADLTGVRLCTETTKQTDDGCEFQPGEILYYREHPMSGQFAGKFVGVIGSSYRIQTIPAYKATPRILTIHASLCKKIEKGWWEER